MFMRRGPVFLTTLIVVVQAWGQEVPFTHSGRFTPSERTSSLTLGGNVEYLNTYIERPYPQAAGAFENLHHIKLTNLGADVLKNPYISINESRFAWDAGDVENNIEAADEPFDEGALKIWTYFNDRVMHRIYPQTGFRSGTPVELAELYGYGNCFNNSSAIARLPSNENKFNYEMAWYKHAISEYKSGDRSAIIDTDLRAFYRGLDNYHLANRLQASRDRHLIRRTHHYGKAYQFDALINEYISNLYVINNYVATVDPDDFRLDYDLRPGESLTLDYGPVTAWYADDYYDGSPSDLANGKFEFDWSAAAVENYTGVPNLVNFDVVGDGPGRQLIKKDAANISSLSFVANHGFQIVFFTLYLDLESNAVAPTVEVSRDSASWFNPVVQTWDGNRLVSKFDMQGISFREKKVFVRIRDTESSAVNAIHNFGYTSFFQLNRRSMPRLRLGANTLAATFGSAPGNYDVGVEISYTEKTAAIAQPVIKPVTPVNGSTLYGNVGEIRWMPAKTQREIVNYEFFLTADTLSGAPLSPNFATYTNAVSLAETWAIFTGGVFDPAGRKRGGDEKFRMNPLPYIQSRMADKSNGDAALARKRTNGVINGMSINPIEEGFFNAGRQYYWKVRALNLDGIWGPWSEYFSFSVNKVMPPEAVKTQVVSGRELLTWTANSSGAPAKNFRVHASNDFLGFEATANNLIGVTDSTSFLVSGQPYTFYRLVAVDSLGITSEVSSIVHKAYPFVSFVPDTVRADTPFSYKIEFSPFAVPLISETDEYQKVYDKLGIEVLGVPSWMTYNAATKMVTGTGDMETIKRSFYSGKGGIQIRASSWYLIETNNVEVLPYYDIQNKKPVIEGAESTAYLGNQFELSLDYADEDRPFGDSVAFSLENSPDWLGLDVLEDQIVFSGTPTEAGIREVTIRAKDKFGDVTVRSLKLRTYSNQLAFSSIAPNTDTLAVPLMDLLAAVGLNEGFSVTFPDNTSLFKAQFVNNQMLVTGNFCFEPGQVVFTIPFVVSRDGDTDLQFDINVTVTRSNKDRQLPFAYQHEVSSKPMILNLNCDFTQVSYTVYTSSGQRAAHGTLGLEPGATIVFDTEGLVPGIYVLSLYADGQRKGIRFFMQ
jgi:hypothetical protein